MTIDLFHIDYERLLEALIAIVVLSFLLERALSFFFETSVFIEFVEAKPAVPEILDEDGTLLQSASPAKPKKKGIRELIAMVVSIGFCYWQGFDAISIILQTNEEPTILGLIITGLIIAGGSKASLALFKDLMGFMSSAEKARQEAKNLNEQ